jgi:hypothetical protein
MLPNEESSWFLVLVQQSVEDTYVYFECNFSQLNW